MSTKIQLLTLSAALVLVSPAAASGQSSCDPSLIQNNSLSIGYRPRGDRCEGIYRRQVSSFGVQLISLTAQSDLRDLCAFGERVHLVIPTRRGEPGSVPVRVQAESLRSDLYYRLDVELKSRNSFELPADPRSHNEVRLTAAELALLAKVPAVAGANRIDALLPVRLAGEPSAHVLPPYRALLMPGRRVRDVFVSLWRYDGATATRIVSERSLNARPYPADTPIAIVLERTDVQQAGLYRSRVNVEFESGEAESLDFYFVHES